jgi:hypothetical protein
VSAFAARWNTLRQVMNPLVLALFVVVLVALYLGSWAAFGPMGLLLPLATTAFFVRAYQLDRRLLKAGLVGEPGPQWNVQVERDGFAVDDGQDPVAIAFDQVSAVRHCEAKNPKHGAGMLKTLLIQVDGVEIFIPENVPGFEDLLKALEEKTSVTPVQA